jgi:type II secretory pathway pseudopilin PulG
MKGFTLIGLLLALAIFGFMLANRLSPKTSGGDPAVLEPIDRANEAAETMQQESEQLEDKLNQQP